MLTYRIFSAVMIFGLALLQAGISAAAMKAPGRGAQYDYLCTESNGPDRKIEWDVLSNENDTLIIGERYDGTELWRETPLYLFGSTIAVVRKAVDGQRRMDFETGGFFTKGDFSALKNLEIGTKAEAKVAEHVTDQLTFDWNYSFSVEKRGLLDHKVLGKTEVVVILENRKTANYESWRKIIYAPSIAGPIAFNYADDLGVDERCVLSAYRAAGTAKPRMSLAAVTKTEPPPEKKTATASAGKTTSSTSQQATSQPASGAAGFPAGVRSMVIVTRTTNYNFSAAVTGKEPSKMVKVPLVGTSLIGKKIGEAYLDGDKLTIVVSE